MVSIQDAKSLASVNLIEHQMLDHIKKALRVTIEWKTPKMTADHKLSSVRFAMQSFARHLRRVIRIEEQDDYLFAVIDNKPNAANEIERLRHQHGDFLDAVDRLQSHLADLSSWQVEEMDRLCDEIVQLLDAVDHHDRKEIDLLQEALLSDEGGEG